jgi:hypothetical protein
MLRRAVSALLVLGAYLVLGAPAAGKLPPGSTFTTCGMSGCETAGKKESFELELPLVTPPLIQHARPAPSGAAAWFRVDLDIPAKARKQGFLVSDFKPHFPVAFVPEVEYIGVPNRGGDFGWVHLRPGQVDAYAHLTSALQPFPEHELASMDRSFIADAQSGGASAGADTDTGGGVPASLIVALVALGALAGVGVVVRARHRRARPAV